MFDPTMQLMLVEARRNSVLKEVKKIRALQATRAASPRFQERIPLRIGELLISIGSKLQERYESTAHPYPKAC